jgi:hypothetical protein
VLVESKDAVGCENESLSALALIALLMLIAQLCAGMRSWAYTNSSSLRPAGLIVGIEPLDENLRVLCWVWMVASTIVILFQAPGHCNTEKLYIIRLSSHKDRMR